jgi:hypothetical protein
MTPHYSLSPLLDLFYILHDVEMQDLKTYLNLFLDPGASANLKCIFPSPNTITPLPCTQISFLQGGGHPSASRSTRVLAVLYLKIPCAQCSQNHDTSQSRTKLDI